jgi:hypothetical protein
MFGAAIGAATFRNSARNGVEVSERKGIGELLSHLFIYGVFQPFRDTHATIKLMIWHN